MTKYESLVEDFEIVAGDSSNVWMFLSPNVPAFDSGWEAHMGIVEELEETEPVLVRQLPLNLELLNTDGTVKEPAGKYFVCQITPEESAMLESDKKYNFVVQVKNQSLGYRQELVQCKMKVKKQGIFR